jgi:hypothetical protein
METDWVVGPKIVNGFVSEAVKTRLFIDYERTSAVTTAG